MTEPYLGEIQILGFPFAPRDWSIANGATLPLRQNTALFSLLGITYGGDGATTFMLPNLAGRGACGAGQSPGNSRRSPGQTFGTAAYSLQVADMPSHTHTLTAYIPDQVGDIVAVPTATSAIGTSINDVFKAFAQAGSGATAMNGTALGPTGSGTPHENRQPFLALTYAIALAGVFPQFN